MATAAWVYDTLIDSNSTVIRVESRGPCNGTTFYLYLAKFICANQDKIIEIRDPGSRPLCGGSYSCHIILKGHHVDNPA